MLCPHSPSFSSVRDWTLDEATAALPRVRETVGRIRDLVGRLRERPGGTGGGGSSDVISGGSAGVVDAGAPGVLGGGAFLDAPGGNGTRPSSNGHGSGPGTSAGSDVEVELRALIEQLSDDGIVVRDPERGLIDFPARSPSGRPYLLCWLHGEDAIEWWHWPDAGFAGRTPLSEPPA